MAETEKKIEAMEQEAVAEANAANPQASAPTKNAVAAEPMKKMGDAEDLGPAVVKPTDSNPDASKKVKQVSDKVSQSSQVKAEPTHLKTAKEETEKADEKEDTKKEMMTDKDMMKKKEKMPMNAMATMKAGYMKSSMKKEDTETDGEEDDFELLTEQEIAELQKMLNEDVVKEKPEWMKNLALQWGETIAEMETTFTELKDGFAEGFADMVATTITEGGNLAENFKNFMVDMVKQIGQLIIKMLVFKALMAAMGMGGLPTGGAGKGFLGSLFGFAEGGLVTGMTPVIVGEGRGTSMSNPEVIAPLDKLRDYGLGGAGGGLLHGSISGENILLSNQRSLISQNRVGGSVTDF